MGKLSAIWKLFHQGEALANSGIWKQRAIATNLLVGFFGAALVAGKAFGYDPHLDTDTVQALAGGVAAIGFIANSFVHVATSDKAGLPPVSQPADTSGFIG